MKKDINFPKVTGVKIAIGKTIDEKGESDWYVYVLNNKTTPINNVMVVSNASENEDGTGRKTSTLRHLIEDIPAYNSARIERIDPAVFGFYNQFWVSFYVEKELFDKKFIIEPFAEWDLEEVLELNMQGKLAE